MLSAFRERRYRTIGEISQRGCHMATKGTPKEPHSALGVWWPSAKTGFFKFIHIHHSADYDRGAGKILFPGNKKVRFLQIFLNR
jgi:hypothetical protein